MKLLQKRDQLYLLGSGILFQLMRQSSLLLLLLLCAFSVQAYDLSIFYCGFSGDFCGQSNFDDTNAKTSFVILAFVNTNSDGSITTDSANFPTDLVKAWQAAGRKVFISVGGQNGNWNYVFSSQDNIDTFVNSVKNTINLYKLDGVDLDIESYNAAPRTVANAIKQLKQAIGIDKLIIVSPEDVAVYQGTGVGDPTVGGNAFNYFVHIINEADTAIDYYQPQAYNNWYDGEVGGSLRYLQDVYQNWRNLPGTGQWDTPLLDFKGVDGNKLLIGVIASTSAGGPGYYATPGTIKEFKDWLANNTYPMKGFMMWDSHWDYLNGYAVSNACVA